MIGTKIISAALVVVCVIVPVVSSTHAEWARNGNLICEGADGQRPAQMIPDGSGGAIVAWKDFRNGRWDIYAQRIDADGNYRWLSHGIAVCVELGNQHEVKITTDGSGGAIIAWLDLRREWDVYVQRIDREGNNLWKTDGIPVCTGSDCKSYLEITTDGNGGAIVTWVDNRNMKKDIYAQRIDTGGTVKWKANGVPICSAAKNKRSPQIIPDGSRGAVIAWMDQRSGNWDIYAQKIDSSGTVQWPENGVAICTTPLKQFLPRASPDGTGGAIITWQNWKKDDSNIFAQRINGAGRTIWKADGVAVCAAKKDQSEPNIIPDGAGGAIITWRDERDGNRDVYVQAVDDSGNVKWKKDGIAVCTETYDQWDSQAIPDGVGGAIITWLEMQGDYRTRDIFSQRIDSEGNISWREGGVPVCLAENSQFLPQLATDGYGGAIIQWLDYRKGIYTAGIYAQRVNRHGYPGYYTPPPEKSEIKEPGN